MTDEAVRHARHLEQFEPERQDAVQRAVRGGLVEVADQVVGSQITPAE